MMAQENLRYPGWYTKFPWNLFVRFQIEYGSNQIRVPQATAGDSVLRYLRFNRGSIISVISYNFPEREWGKHTTWYQSLVHQNRANGVHVRAVGGPEIEAKDSLESLLKEGILTQLAILRTPETFHVILVDQPKQLWVETYHKEGTAQDCYYTASPYAETWEGAVKRLEALIESGENYRRLS